MLIVLWRRHWLSQMSCSHRCSPGVHTAGLHLLLGKRVSASSGTAFREAAGNRLGLYLNQVPGLQDQESGTPSSFIDASLIVISFTRNAPAPNKKSPHLKGPLLGTAGLLVSLAGAGVKSDIAGPSHCGHHRQALWNPGHSWSWIPFVCPPPRLRICAQLACQSFVCPPSQLACQSFRPAPCREAGRKSCTVFDPGQNPDPASVWTAESLIRDAWFRSKALSCRRTSR